MRTLFHLLLALSIPLVLVMGVVRAVTQPWFPAWEYRRAGFPEDRYGLTTDDRLALAQEAITYLNLPARLARLDHLRLPDGSLAFDERELDHMRDVKEVYNYLTLVAVLALAVGISAGVVLYRRGGAAAVWGTLSDGGLITLLGLGALGVLMLTSWDAFFTGFHALFFESGTWRFSYSDTLIRLFPQQFWQDAGILVVIVVALLAFVLALVGRVMQRRLVRHERTPEVPSIPSQPQGE